MDSGMLLLIIVLGGLSLYFIVSPTSLIGPWLHNYSKKEKEQWSGETIEPEPLIHYDDKGPHTVKDAKKPKKKRVYKRRKKK
jgi:hypothetical protein